MRKAIQASIFRTLGFDVGFEASGVASDAIFDQLALFRIEILHETWRVSSEPIDELSAEPQPRDSG